VLPPPQGSPRRPAPRPSRAGRAPAASPAHRARGSPASALVVAAAARVARPAAPVWPAGAATPRRARPAGRRWRPGRRAGRRGGPAPRWARHPRGARRRSPPQRLPGPATRSAPASWAPARRPRRGSARPPSPTAPTTAQRPAPRAAQRPAAAQPVIGAAPPGRALAIPPPASRAPRPAARPPRDQAAPQPAAARRARPAPPIAAGTPPTPAAHQGRRRSSAASGTAALRTAGVRTAGVRQTWPCRCLRRSAARTGVRPPTTARRPLAWTSVVLAAATADLPTRAGAAGPGPGPLLPQATAVLLPAGGGPDTVASRRADGRGVPQRRGRPGRRDVRRSLRPCPGAANRTAASVSGVHGVHRPCGHAALRCPPADTAAAGACPPLQEVVAWPASAGRVQPPASGPPELGGEPLAELLAHIGHGRPLQGQASSAVSPP
jgi:hypothetical protein